MNQNLELAYKKITRKLWFRPLLFCVLSIFAALISHLADDSFPQGFFPEIKKSSLENLLTTISASMLVIAIFAVGSMLSAFASASGTATPRSFKIIVADDVSQNALSVYIGSFIFSIVATVALKNEYYGDAGYFILFVLTIFVFSLVIITFLRWVDQISKLGRLGHTIKKIEEVALNSLINRKKLPFMGGVAIRASINNAKPIYSHKIGYVQSINMEKIQNIAVENKLEVVLNCIPGVFATLDKPLFYYITSQKDQIFKEEDLLDAFHIEDSRSFNNDPRFGLIALTEIASRALSPGINDPGTAFAILGSHVRLFSIWFKTEKDNNVIYDRVQVPSITIEDMFDDAFRPIARDGAGNLEVMLRLQKSLISIANLGDNLAKETALTHSKHAFERAKIAMDYPIDLEMLKKESLFSK